MTHRLLISLALVCALSHSVTAQTITATKLNLSNFPFITGTSDTTLATVSNTQIPASKAVKIYANRHLGGRPLSTVAPTTGQVIGWNGSTWIPVTPSGGGGGGTVYTTTRLAGDGTPGTPLDIAQQSATTGQVLQWSGTAWVPSHGTPYTYVTSSSSITTAFNTVLIPTLSASITLGLPTCDATNDGKQFLFQKSGGDTAYSVTIDPSGTQVFSDGAFTKIIFNTSEFQCTCRFSGGTGTWFYNF